MTLNQTFILAGSMLIVALALFGYAGKTAAQMIREQKQEQRTQTQPQVLQAEVQPNYGAPYPFTAQQLLAMWIEALELPAEQITRANIERIFKVKLRERQIDVEPEGRTKDLIQYATWRLEEQLNGKSEAEEKQIITDWLRKREDAKNFTYPTRPIYETSPGKDWYFELKLDEAQPNRGVYRFSFYFGSDFYQRTHPNVIFFEKFPEVCVTLPEFRNALKNLGWDEMFYLKNNIRLYVSTSEILLNNVKTKCINGFNIDILSSDRLERFTKEIERIKIEFKEGKHHVK